MRGNILFGNPIGLIMEDEVTKISSGCYFIIGCFLPVAARLLGHSIFTI